MRLPKIMHHSLFLSLALLAMRTGATAAAEEPNEPRNPFSDGAESETGQGGGDVHAKVSTPDGLKQEDVRGGLGVKATPFGTFSYLRGINESADHYDSKMVPKNVDLLGVAGTRRLEDDWYLLGDEMKGASSQANSGSAVAMSEDGTRVAVGARYDGNDSKPKAGSVRIYDLKSGSSGCKSWEQVCYKWHQVGQDIIGEASWDQSGTALDMSADGSRVVIGAPYNDNTGFSAGYGCTSFSAGHVRIYDLKNVNGSFLWQKTGQDIDGETPKDLFGKTVAMSGDGNRVAIGAPYDDDNGYMAGHVRIYDLKKNVTGSFWWQKVGQDVNGDPSDLAGKAIAMSADGTRVAVAVRANYGGRFNARAGRVRIYELGEGSWKEVGQDIVGEAGYDFEWFYSVAMSADGNRVAIGAAGNDGGALNGGHVRVYALKKDGNGSSSWQKLGQDIDGDTWFDKSGNSVAISAEGTRVAIGAKASGVNARSGYVRIYDLKTRDGESLWLQVGLDLFGEGYNDLFGESLAMSADGSRVAIGAPRNDDDDTGHVRVYEIYMPTSSPSSSPSRASSNPSYSSSPSISPSSNPSSIPSKSPSTFPSSSPSSSPSSNPSSSPSHASNNPSSSSSPSSDPSSDPSSIPSKSPSTFPSSSPSSSPSSNPSSSPSKSLSTFPSSTPSSSPSSNPSSFPSKSPSTFPSSSPTSSPTSNPSSSPSKSPSTPPSSSPTSSFSPSSSPSQAPSTFPSLISTIGFSGAANIVAGSTLYGAVDAIGAIAMGAGSTMIGSMNSGGAIAMGAGSTMIGALNSDGAVTVGADSTVTGAIKAAGAVTLGANAKCASVDCDGALSLGANAILTPGTFKAASVSVAGDLFLDAQGVDNAKWTFTISGALLTAAGSKMSFIGSGVDNAIVEWRIDGAVTLGADSIVIGNVTHVGGLTLGAGASIIGDVKKVAGE